MLRTVLLVTALMSGVDADVPAQLRRAPLPTSLPRLQAQCQLLFTIDVDAAGAVSSVDPVCRQPLLTTVFTRAIERWEFDPAIAGGLATPSRVLVAVLLRPPFLLNFGEPRAEPHQVPEELPAPEATPAPAYPPTALGDALVLVEVGVDASGAVSAARALGGHTGFDEAALEAARRWRFRPAQSGGAPVSSQAYIVFGFEEPVLAPLPR